MSFHYIVITLCHARGYTVEDTVKSTLYHLLHTITPTLHTITPSLHKPYTHQHYILSNKAIKK